MAARTRITLLYAGPMASPGKTLAYLWSPFTRLWLTLGLMAGILICGFATDSVTANLSERWMQRFGTRPMDFWSGNWSRLVTSLFLTWGGWTLAAVLAMVAVMVGWSEWEIGRRRTFITFFFADVGALALSALAGNWLMQAFGRSPDIFQRTADVGPSAGCYGCLAVVLATGPGRWRRVLTLLVAAILLGVLLGRGLSPAVETRVTASDFEHVLAYGLGLCLSLWLRRRRTTSQLPPS